MIRLSVPTAGFDRLTRFIHEHYVRDAERRPIRIRRGYYTRSALYLATGRYHALTYNSNHWTATALQVAGVPTDPHSTVTAAAVMRQVVEIANPTHAGRTVGR